MDTFSGLLLYLLRVVKALVPKKGRKGYENCQKGYTSGQNTVLSPSFSHVARLRHLVLPTSLFPENYQLQRVSKPKINPDTTS